MTLTKNLRSRLVLSAGLWILAIMLIGGFALSYAFSKTTEQAFDNKLDIYLGALVSAAKADSNGKIEIIRGLGDPRFEQVFSGWYWQVSKDDQAISRSRSLWDQELAWPHLDDTLGTISKVDFIGPRDRNLRLKSQLLKVDAIQSPVRFTVIGDLSELMAQKSQFGTLLIMALGLLGAGAFSAIVLQVRFGLRPLRLLAGELDKIRKGTLDRLRGGYPEEIMPLVSAMDLVLDENEERNNRARRHVGNLAHALKTPLTLLLSELHSDIPPSKKTVLEQQIGIITRLVEYHLTRAATVGSANYISTAVSIRDVVDAIHGGLDRIFADKHLAITIDVPNDLVFIGERQDLEELLGNLMENACKWARRQIVIHCFSMNRHLVICVEDDGHGMPPSLRERATVRGKRFDEQEPGFGLGLSIVADLVDLYDGTLTFNASPLGGLKVEVRFSRPDDEPKNIK